MTTIERYVVKPATIGTTAFLMSKTVFPSLVDASWNKNFVFSSNSMLKGLYGGSTSVSVPVMAGVAVGLGSVVAELSHDFIFPHISWLDKSSDKASMLLAGSTAGLGMAGVISLGNPSGIADLGLPTILGVGMVSEIVGDTIYSKFVKSTFESFTQDS
jgi:hypothetical protein